MALGVKKGLAVEAEEEEEEERSEAEAPPDMAKGLLSWLLAASAFLAPATSASKLTSAEFAPRKSSGDLLGFPPERELPCAGDP